MENCKPPKPLFRYRKCVNEKKQEVIDFVKKHGRKPNPNDGLSWNVGSAHHYGNKASKSYDPIFRQTMKSLGAIKEYSAAKRKQAILRFYERKGFLPKIGSSNKKEHRLGVNIRNYTDKKAYPTTYDKAFHATICKLKAAT